jgi:hypothetical protein
MPRFARLLGGAVALLASTLAAAEPQLHLAATAGLSVGGDKLAKIKYDSGRTENITAGGLVYLGAGPSLEFKGTPWSVQALLGYHVDDNSANESGAHFKFDRTTLDVLGFYRVGNHRLGAGVYHAMSPAFTHNTFFDTSGNYYPAETVKFDDANGLALEYNYLPPASKFGVSARAVSISYDAKTLNGVTVAPKSINGSFIAIGVYLYL